MEPLEIVAQVLGALNALEIPYMIVGSLSSNVYGDPRFTKDADFVVQLGDRPLSALMQNLGPDFKVDRQLGFETVTGTNRYHLVHVPTDFLIELFELTNEPHNQARFTRKRSTPFAGTVAFFPTAEDVIIQKLRWYHKAKRPKDLQDLQNVLEMQEGNLDMPYIRQWCQQHGTLELLEKTIASIPPLPD